MSVPSTKVIELPAFVNATFIARLARTVVMELQPLARILTEVGLTEDHYEVIKRIPYFKRVCEEFAAEWNKISSTQDRLRLISAVLLEEGLPRVGSNMIDPNVTAAVAVETGKFLAKVAGVGEGAKAGEASGGDRFTITINLGDDHTVKVTKDVTPRVSEIEAAEDSNEVPRLPEGETAKETVARDPEGESVDTEEELLPEGKKTDEKV